MNSQNLCITATESSQTGDDQLYSDTSSDNKYLVWNQLVIFTGQLITLKLTPFDQYVKVVCSQQNKYDKTGSRVNRAKDYKMFTIETRDSLHHQALDEPEARWSWNNYQKIFFQKCFGSKQATTGSRQCDQIIQNFTSLGKNLKNLAIFEPTYATGQIFVVENGQISRENLAIWSHWIGRPRWMEAGLLPT